MGFFDRWLDGRIEDLNAGGQGRALRASISTRAPVPMKGGERTTSMAVRVQRRPDPLAKQGSTRNRSTTIDHEAKPHDPMS